MAADPAVGRQVTTGLRDLPVDPRLGLIFPGQGSQHVGMCRQLYDMFESVRVIFALADSVLGTGLTSICFHGPEIELTSTANAQPAILTASIAQLTASTQIGTIDRCPVLLAGHSLGEYTALVAAGAMQFEDGLTLVHQRGQIMSQAGERSPGKMCAILGLGEGAVHEVCAASGAEPANFNAPTQIVVGGTPRAVDRAMELARSRGGKALPLNVSGAFHTSLMKTAATQFAGLIDRVQIQDPLIPVISNVTGLPMMEAGAVRSDLRAQMVSPVRWQQTVELMVESGVEEFLEVGPGNVLTALLKRSVPGVTAMSVDGLPPPDRHPDV